MRSDFSRRLKGLIAWLGYILLTLLLIAIGEWLPLMPAVQRFQEENPVLDRALTGVTLAMTVFGTLLLALTQFLVRLPDPRTGRGRAQTSKAAGSVKGPGWFFIGKMISAGFSDEARFWRVRKAFQDGEWWRVPRWRRLTLMMLGAILLFYGLFGLLFLLSSPGLKLFFFLIAVYVTVRSVYAFAADQPSRKNDDAAG